MWALWIALIFSNIQLHAQTATVTLRPSYIDLSSTTSESAVLMTLSSYSSNDARYRLYNSSYQYYTWDEATDAYISSTSYASGPQVVGTPSSTTTFWILFQRGGNNSATASYRDRLNPYSVNYQTVALPAATSISSPFNLTGNFVGSGSYDKSVKHVVLGYSGSTLITAVSSALSTGAFTLVCPGGTTIDKIEIRAVDNTLIETKTGSWTTTTNVGNIPNNPLITVSATSLSGFTYMEGNGPSTEQNFTISGADLSSSISISAPTDYEISKTSGVAFSAENPITLTQSGGVVTNTSIFVRLKAGLAADNYDDEIITASSTGATNKTVACNGYVDPQNPLIYVSTSSLTGFKYIVDNGPSNEQSFNISGEYLTDNVTVTAPAEFEVSETSGSGFTSSVELLPDAGTLEETTIYVRLKAGLDIDEYSENITATSDDATDKTVTCNGLVIASEPTNYPTGFTATVNSYNQITVTWTDASGGQLPAAYLVKASVMPAVSEPADGTPESDAALIKIFLKAHNKLYLQV